MTSQSSCFSIYTRFCSNHPNLLLASFQFEHAVLLPPPRQHVELLLPAVSSFQCPCLSPCGLISLDALSQPQHGACCLLSWARSLCCADMMATRCTGPHSPSPHTSYLFAIHSTHLHPSHGFPYCPSSRSTAVGLSGSISTLQYPGCCRATMILLTLSWRTNIVRNVFYSVKNEQDRYNFERWEKTDGLLPGNTLSSRHVTEQTAQWRKP